MGSLLPHLRESDWKMGVWSADTRDGRETVVPRKLVGVLMVFPGDLRPDERTFKIWPAENAKSTMEPTFSEPALCQAIAIP